MSVLLAIVEDIRMNILSKHLYIREVHVDDYPRFPHRGVLIDTARHYIFKEVIFDVLESMAQNKLNVLHWHIVDDNSFPYQSEVLPKLSQQGAFHPTLVYTQKDIAEIIEYARLRGIRVIPEFDSPGHTFAWGLGYPEIKTTCYENGKPLFGPLGPLDPSKNSTFEFLRSLFREIFNAFPDNYIHLGGDEVHTNCWWTNPELRRTMETVAGISPDLNPRDYVQSVISYYFHRLTKDLKEINQNQSPERRFIMWEDVIKSANEIPKDSILQLWMSRQNVVQQLNEQGFRTIYSSCWYLDHSKYGIQWSEYYLCDPSPYFDEGDEKDKLLGGEACLWSEYIENDNLMTMLWPRASAVAERLWSAKTVQDINSAGRRLQEHKCRMMRRGFKVGYASGPDYCLRPLEAKESYKDDAGALSEEIIMRQIKSISGTETPKQGSNTVEPYFSSPQPVKLFFDLPPIELRKANYSQARISIS
ncbi:hypothetical protein ACJMK2_009407 [Sinanodonta woodiana]|uniref:beta-N-acetylhexosaminidase n=1 Tax=Sinanodonta woodiana TaxID=1069815 RepID=A0ABD3VC46_SINWO